jgi:hypothetical protein
MPSNPERPRSWVNFGAKQLFFGMIGCAALGLSSCGTDAVGVSQCREIEAARCEAAAFCPEIDFDGDVEECKRYTRDHCLHGTATEKAPRPGETSACVNAIDDAAKCAKTSPDALADDCGIDRFASGSKTTVCDIILEPEKAKACSFLIPPEDVPEVKEDAGSDGGS